MTRSSQMSDLLRQTICESGIPLLQIANQTGISRASLIRFARGDTSLRLDIADKLADYFGLVLVRQSTKGLFRGKRSTKKL